MTTPQEPAPEPENPDVKEGDVTENPTQPEDDGSDPHTDDPAGHAPPDPSDNPEPHPAISPGG